MFEAQVGCTPDAIAFAVGNKRLSYRELNNQANQLARYLQSLEVKPQYAYGDMYRSLSGNDHEINGHSQSWRNEYGKPI